MEKERKGFTIIEALIAFSILALAFGAFTSSATTSMKTFKHAEKSHLASKIAKEGLELVISKKDNHLSCYHRRVCESWRDGNFPSEGSYEVSSARWEELLVGGEFKSFDPNRSLCFLSDTNPPGLSGKFGYCSGDGADGDGKATPGKFTREIEISDLNVASGDLEGIRVRSIVRWDGGSREKIFETILYMREN